MIEAERKGHTVRRAAAEAVVKKLMETPTPSPEEIARAGEAAADIEYLRLVAGERPGPDRPDRFWRGVLIGLVLTAVLLAAVVVAFA